MRGPNDTSVLVERLNAARRAFWDALCDAQSKLTGELEPVVCECGSRRMRILNGAGNTLKTAITRKRRCEDCGAVALTAEFVIARRVKDKNNDGGLKT